MLPGEPDLDDMNTEEGKSYLVTISDKVIYFDEENPLDDTHNQHFFPLYSAHEKAWNKGIFNIQLEFRGVKVLHLKSIAHLYLYREGVNRIGKVDLFGKKEIMGSLSLPSNELNMVHCKPTTEVKNLHELINNGTKVHFGYSITEL